jgi:hypothetical protein
MNQEWKRRREKETKSKQQESKEQEKKDKQWRPDPRYHRGRSLTS